MARLPEDRELAVNEVAKLKPEDRGPAVSNARPASRSCSAASGGGRRSKSTRKIAKRQNFRRRVSAPNKDVFRVSQESG